MYVRDLIQAGMKGLICTYTVNQKQIDGYKKEGMLALLMQESSPQLQSLVWFQQHDTSLHAYPMLYLTLKCVAGFFQLGETHELQLLHITEGYNKTKKSILPKDKT